MALSQNDQIRAFFNGVYDEGADLTKKEVRAKAINDFCDKYKVQNRKSAMAAIGKILPQIAAERGIRPDAVRPTKKVKAAKYDKSLNLNINPQPVEGVQGQQQQQQQGGPNWQQGSAQQQQQQFGGQQGQYIYDPETIGKFWGTLNDVVRIMITDAEALTPEQERALGAAWHKDWNRFFAGNDRLSLLLALMATLGILGRNWAQGMRKGAEKKKKKGETQTIVEQGRKAAAEMNPNDDRDEAPADEGERNPITGSKHNPLSGEVQEK